MTELALSFQHGNQAISPTGSLDSYLSYVRSIPLLSFEEELSLSQRLQNQNDLDAARQLVVSNLRFVVRVARKYSGYGLTLADLIQEGNIGLMKAVKRFDHKQGVRLISFAVHWIKAEIHEFIIRNWRIVKIATTKAQRKLFFNLRRMRKDGENLNVKTTQAIAQKLNVSSKDVREMEKRFYARDSALENHDVDGDDKRIYAPIQYLADASYEAESDCVAEEALQKSDALAQAYQQLDPRAQHIIQTRFFQEEKTTLQTLSEYFNISVERVRQLEQQALKKLKTLLLTQPVFET